MRRMIACAFAALCLSLASPLVAGDLVIPWRGGGETVRAGSVLKDAGRARHLVLAFEGAPSQETVAALSAAGVVVHHDGEDLLGATVPAGADLSAVAGLAWAGPVKPSAKGLASELPSLARYSVEFFYDVAPERQRALLEGTGCRVLSSSLPDFVSAVFASDAAIRAAAEFEEVVFISELRMTSEELMAASYCPGVRLENGYYPQYLDYTPRLALQEIPSRLNLYFGQGTDKIPSNLEFDEALRAMQEWQKVLRLDSDIMNSPGQGNTCDIVFRSEPATSDILVSDGRYNVLAYTFFPGRGSDMYMDAAEEWRRYPASRIAGHDVYSVVLHELGHALDIRTHLANPNSVMYGSYGGVRAGLHRDDIAYVHGQSSRRRGLVVDTNSIRWTAGRPPVPGERDTVSFDIENVGDREYNNVRVSLWCADAGIVNMGVRSEGFVTIPRIAVREKVPLPEPLLVEVAPPASGTRDMMVLLQSDETRLYSGFNLTVGGTPVNDRLEPNNDMASATQLGPGDFTGLVMENGDEDWIRVIVPAGQTLYAATNANDERMPVLLKLLDENGTLLVSGFGQNLVPVQFTNEQNFDRAYYLRAMQGRLGAVSGNNYSLHILLETPDSPFAQPPRAPEFVRAVPGDFSVTAYWPPVAGATAYRVLYSDVPDEAPPYSAQVNGSIPSGAIVFTNSVFIEGLPNNRSLEFTVEALNNHGTGPQAPDVETMPTFPTFADPAEPDNGPSQAHDIAAGETITGRSLEPLSFGSESGDEDWFRFTLTQKRAVRVTAVTSAGTVSMALLDSTLQFVGEPLGFGNTLEIIDCGEAPGPGTYYIRVSDFGFDGIADYSLKLETLECQITSAPMRAILAHEPGSSDADINFDSIIDAADVATER